MQRAAASLPPQSQNTPTQDHPSAKRQKFTDSTPSTPIESSSQYTKEFADRSEVTAALKVEADARAARRAKIQREGGETEWVLNLNLPMTNGHSPKGDDCEPDLEKESLWSSRSTGRQTYGAFKRRQNTTSITTSTPTTTQLDLTSNDADLSPASSSGSASEDEDEDGEILQPQPHSTSKLPKSEKQPQRHQITSTSNFNTPDRSSSKRKNHTPYHDEDPDHAARHMDSLNLSRMSSLSGHHGSGGSKFGGGGGGGGRIDKHKAFKKKRKMR